MSVSLVTRVICEGPRCINGPGKTPLVLEWEDEKAKQDPSAVPDAAYRLVIQRSFVGEQHVFCSVRCLHDWHLNGYQVPLSPREQALQEAANDAAAAKQQTPKLEAIDGGKANTAPPAEPAKLELVPPPAPDAGEANSQTAAVTEAAATEPEPPDTIAS